MSGTSNAAGVVTMELEPLSAQPAAGSVPDFRVTIENRGTEPVTLCTYMLDYRLKASMTAQNEAANGVHYECQPFKPVKWRDVTGEDFHELAPGDKLTTEIRFGDEKGFGWVARHSQPPVLGVNQIIPGFPSGSWEFRVCLTDQMALYVGEEGVFDRKLEARLIPSQLPGGQQRKAYGGLLEATAKLSFR